jgi:hypothetical protein
MSIPWMIAIAGMIALEKLLPWKALANRSIAIVFLVVGFGVALAPEYVPALTLPDSTAAAKAMHAMSSVHSRAGKRSQTTPVR